MRLHSTRWILVVTVLLTSAAGADTVWMTVESPGWSGSSHLFSWDSQTGQLTDRGALEGLHRLTDLAIDDAGNLYGVGWANRLMLGEGRLYALTPGSPGESASYTQLPVGKGALSWTVNALEWHDEALWAASGTGMLQRLTHDGQQWHVADSAWMGLFSGGDLAFAPDGTLYGAMSGGRIATINADPDSGHFGRADLLSDTGYNQLYGLGFGAETLYATTSGPGHNGRSWLVQVDPLSGDTTELAYIDRTVWGMAVQPSAVPEPTALAMLVGGGGLLLVRHRRKRVA